MSDPKTGADEKDSKKIWENQWLERRRYNKKDYTSGKIQTFLQFSRTMENQYIDEKIFPKTRGLLSLECGCGGADTSNYFASKRGYKVVCLDISQTSVKVAKENLQEEGNSGTFIVGDVNFLPFANATFDVVFCFALLEVFENVQPVINEMVRVLKPGGIFFAAIPSRGYLTSLHIISKIAKTAKLVLKGKFKAAFREDFRPFRAIPLSIPRSLNQYKDFMRCAGLNEVRMDGFCPFPVFSRIHQIHQIDSIYLQIVKIITKFREKLKKPHPWVSNVHWSVWWFAYGIKG